MTRRNQIILGASSLSIIVIIVVFTAVSNQKKSPVRNIISGNVKEVCKIKDKIECQGNCLDGFSADCYFDSTKYNKENLQSGFSLSKETKNVCFGIHSSSVCGDCHNTFELRKNGVLGEVSCEEFFQAIENKNSECDNCVDTIFSGCC